MIPVSAIAVPPLPEELERLPRPALEDTVERLIDHLNGRDPDPDLEDDDPAETAGDDKDVAWVEWDRMAPRSKGGSNITGNIAGRFSEDDEDDDEDCCGAADDDPGRHFSDGFPGDEADREEDDPSGGNVTDEPHDAHSEDGY